MQRKKELVKKVLVEGKTMIYVARKLRMRYSVARKVIQDAIDKEKAVKQEPCSEEQGPVQVVCKQENIEPSPENSYMPSQSAPRAVLEPSAYQLVQPSHLMPYRPCFNVVPAPPLFYLVTPFM